jgi:hypothetical protein
VTSLAGSKVAHSVSGRVQSRIHPSGLAVAADGAILVNIAHWETTQDPTALLERAIAEGGRLFIGVQLSPREAKEALRLLDDRAAEAAGVIAGRRQRRRRDTARRMRRTPS